MTQHLLKNSFLRGVLFLLLCAIGLGNAWGEEVTVTFDASKQGYTNAQVLKNVTITDGITVIFDKGTNSNTCKYYTTGTAIRVYGGGYFTIASTIGNITQVVLTYGKDDGSNAIKSEDDVFDGTTWTGTAKSIKLTVSGSSGHRKIKTIAVTYVVDSSITYSIVDRHDSGSNREYYVGDTPTADGLALIDNSGQEITDGVTWSFDPQTIQEDTKSVTASAEYQGVLAKYTYNITNKGTRTLSSIYNLTPIYGGSNGYATESNIDVNDVKWHIIGNTHMTPWRIGGKSLTNANRDIKCSTPINGTFGKVVVSIGSTNGDITFNSLTLSVADNPGFTNATKYKHTSNLKANTEHTFDITPATNAYYKITYNVTVPGESNQYYEFSGTKFYRTDNVEISSAGLATFCLPYNATVPDGLTAYTATDNGTSVTLTAKEDNTIAAGEGVVLKGKEGTYTFIATAENAAATEGNQMVGVTEDTELTEADNAYMLTRKKEDGSIAFRLLKTNYTLGANKAYLKVDDSANTRELIPALWDDNATGIDNIAKDEVTATGDIYNLAGQKLMRAQKGINIINGKLVIK